MFQRKTNESKHFAVSLNIIFRNLITSLVTVAIFNFKVANFVKSLFVKSSFPRNLMLLLWDDGIITIK